MLQPKPVKILRSRFRNLASGFRGLALALSLVGRASAETSWLDQPPKTWNQASAGVPAAPPLLPQVQLRCRAQERPPSGPEETQVAAAGWRLETYWPTNRSGNAAIVMADTNYDGMCRPYQFNAFVFAGGQFAGTLSPVDWISRSDGVLRGRPAFLSDGRIVATFLRYAPTDPLCCPSRPATQVIYTVDQTPTGPVVDPDQIGTAVVPAQLPTSGSPLATGGIPLVLGSALIGLGWRWRKVSR